MRTSHLLILLSSYLLLLLPGCIPPGKLPARCAEDFPCRDSTIIRERLVQDTVYFPEYAFEYIDTTKCPPGLTDTLVIVKEKAITVPAKTVTVTLPCRDSLIYIRDTALEALLKEQLSDADKERLKLQRKADRQGAWKWAFIILALVLGLGVGFSLAKRRS
jgi:hypothetical protein